MVKGKGQHKDVYIQYKFTASVSTSPKNKIKILWVIPCQITQWEKLYPIQLCSNLVYGVILTQQAQTSNFSSIR